MRSGRNLGFRFSNLKEEWDKVSPSPFPHLAKAQMRLKRGIIQVTVGDVVESGAEGGSRTRTSFRTTDFKSAASAIPPPRHLIRNSNCTKSFHFLKTPIARPDTRWAKLRAVHVDTKRDLVIPVDRLGAYIVLRIVS